MHHGPFKRNLSSVRGSVLPSANKCNLSCDNLSVRSRIPANASRGLAAGAPACAPPCCNAAFDELGEKGYDGFNMEAVARRSGVHKTSVYRRWPTREALVMDALDSRSDRHSPISATVFSVRTCERLPRTSSTSCRRHTARHCSRVWCPRSISPPTFSRRSGASGESALIQVGTGPKGDSKRANCRPTPMLTL